MNVSSSTDNRHDLEQRIRALGPWFHRMEVGGIDTAPEHFLGDYPRAKFAGFVDALPKDMTGMTVLDVGCNAGFYSFEMKRRGAAKVIGIDSDERYLAQARLVAAVEKIQGIEFRRMNVYQVGSLGMKFDFVIFMGVLYHLRHPLLALDLLHEHVVGDWLLFQSLQRGSKNVLPLEENYPFSEERMFDDPGYPKMHFVERRYSDDDTNWWIPNRACVEAMLRSTGFSIVAQPEPEVYVCRRGQRASDVGEWAIHRELTQGNRGAQ